MSRVIHLLCAGAAQSLVKALQPLLLARCGAMLSARFGAVGAMKEALLAGDACDLLIVTDKMVDELAQAGLLRSASRAPLGRVRTGIAVRTGAARPDVSTPAALRAALLEASAIYFPDPQRATAGIYFAQMMHELGVHDALAPRCRSLPNGATAMRELAGCDVPRAIGCTQITEINDTEGVDLVGALPPRFELATVYAAAVSASAAEPVLAEHFIAMLTGAESRTLRESGGFEC